MMSVLDKSITIISPDRNKKEIGDLRTRIIEAYHTTKVRIVTDMFSRICCNDFIVIRIVTT